MVRSTCEARWLHLLGASEKMPGVDCLMATSSMAAPVLRGLLAEPPPDDERPVGWGGERAERNGREGRETCAKPRRKEGEDDGQASARLAHPWPQSCESNTTRGRKGKWGECAFVQRWLLMVGWAQDMTILFQPNDVRT
jgi:hypothetical protein